MSEVSDRRSRAPEELEVVATFATLVDSEPCRSALLASGFQVFLIDANVVAIDPALWPALGGVKVAVPSSQAEDVRAFLRAAEAGELASSPDLSLVCPSCGSNDVGFIPMLNRLSTIGLTALGGVVAPIRDGHYQCASCGSRVP
jgi:hypothetical protein